MEKRVEGTRKLVELAFGEELMILLGRMNFLAAFVDLFANKAAPLYDVLQGTEFTKKRKQRKPLVIPDWNQQ